MNAKLCELLHNVFAFIVVVVVATNSLLFINPKNYSSPENRVSHLGTQDPSASLEKHMGHISE